jgi:8-oxo-dGTP diphosphatase
VPATILAAGGVVVRRRWGRRQVLLVRRGRYTHETGWTLPKGKVNPGEAPLEAALREVGEETGCRARADRFAGCVRYIANGQPKLVLFWSMRPIGSEPPEHDGEVSERGWVRAREAMRRLHYASERLLLRRALARRC